MSKKLAAALSSAFIAMAGLTFVGTTAAPAAADPVGEYHRCWDISNGWQTVASDYKQCTPGQNLDIFSTATGARKLSMDGTCARQLRLHNYTPTSIRTKCQEWPVKNYPGGDYWENWI